MNGLSSPGLGSGLDINSIVTSLVNAEIQPQLTSLNTKEMDIQAKLSGLGQIKSALSSFQSGLSSIGTLDSFQAMTATLSQPGIIEVTANNEAVAGNYQVEVNQLAKRHNLASASFSSQNETIGNGTLTIEFGTYNETQTAFTLNPDKPSQNISISNTANSLVEIMEVINSADVGVSASIVKDESGSRLLLSSDQTGAAHALKITVTDDDGNNTDNSGLSQLLFDPASGNSNLNQTVSAQNSEVLINGLTVTHHDNRLSDNITGLTIDLRQSAPGEIIDVDITQDKSTAKSKIQIFISQYNEVISTINNLTAYDPETQTGELFLGDASIRSLKNQLTNILYTPIENASNHFSMIAELGVTTGSNGLLQINHTKLDNALDEHFEEVGRLFARGGYTSDSLIDVNSVGDEIPSGVYGINLSTANLGISLEGSIGGISANSSDGHLLTGTGIFSSLSLAIIGGNAGNRGTVTVFEGLSTQFNSLIDTYLSIDGSLEARTDSLNDRLDDLETQREHLEFRAGKIEDTYYQQFNAMDAQLAQFQSLSTFLTQQLASLTAFSEGE